MKEEKENIDNNKSEVVKKKDTDRFDFQNAGMIEGGMGYTRIKEHPYIIFTDSQGKKFNELSYTNLGQFFVAYQINKKKKTFDSVHDKNDKDKVQIFSSNDEAINFVKKKSGDYLIKHEFVYQLTYGLMHEIEYDGGRAKQITVPETEMKKIIPFVVSDLIRIDFGWQPTNEKWKIINLYKVTGQDTYTAGIFIEDYAIYTEGAKDEQNAQKIISLWQNGLVQYKVVQGTQLLGRTSGSIAEDKYTEGEMNFIRPQNVLFEELTSDKSDEEYKKGGYIRTKAKQLQLINSDDDEITKEHLKKIDDLGGIWQRRVKLYKTLHKMAKGGAVDDDKLIEPVKVPTIEDEVRKYANDKNEVSTSNLKLVTGSKSLGYPVHTVGTIKLRKQFLKPYYKIIDNLI